MLVLNNKSMIKKDWISSKIEIKETVNKNKGMFAVEPIKMGERVLVWGGDYVNHIEAEEAKKSGKLVMQWDEDLFSVENRGDDVGYFINHSCDSNTWMADTFTLVAKRDIKVGEELTIDYALIEVDENYISKWECKCGSSFCRKKVTGQDWCLVDLQERYKDHFLPFINKKIINLKTQNV